MSFTKTNSASESIVPIVGLKSSYAIDFDFDNGTIYTVDDNKDAIYEVKQDGSQLNPVISTGLQRPQGIAVDWVSKNLYWTDSGTRLIEVCDVIILYSLYENSLGTVLRIQLFFYYLGISGAFFVSLLGFSSRWVKQIDFDQHSHKQSTFHRGVSTERIHILDRLGQSSAED